MQTTSSRLLALLSLLQARRDWPGSLLADRLEVSTRTVRRDVERLRELGYPIHTTKGPDGGYRLGAGTEMPPLVFDDDQTVAITVALQELAASGSGLADAALPALTSIRQVLPARLRHRVDVLQGAIVPGTGLRARPAVDAPVLMTLGTAIHGREIVRFDYEQPPRSSRNETTQRREVEPHHLVTRNGRWYLVAWDVDRTDWRTFRVDRITPSPNTGPRFTPRDLPGGDVAAFVTARFRGANPAEGTADWPCQGEVILGLPAEVVATYAGDDAVEPLGPDRCRLRTGSWSWTSLVASIARFDADIDVVGPPELAAAFALLAQRFTRSSQRQET